MNREEAIKELQESHDMMRSYDIDSSESRLMTALNMAIKALEQQPCEDAISRQAVRHILNHEVKMPIKVWKKGFELVDDLPPVTPQPKTGHWIVDRDDSRRWDKVRFYCSECGKWQTYGRTDYCPSCGARMIEPQERSDKE